MKRNNEYSGWLVASDIDGTLLSGVGKLPKKNISAIKDFVGKGGKFTLASSRNPQSMRRHIKDLPSSLSPAVVMNGAGIYDFKIEKMVSFSPLSEKSMNSVIDIANEFATLDAIVFTKDIIYITGIGLWGWFFNNVENLDHKFVKNIEDVPKENWGKVVFCGSPWRVEKLRKRFKKVFNPSFDVIEANFVAVEVVEHGINKGTALMKLAKLVKVDPTQTCGIGNGMNDSEMLMAAGVSAACGQSPSKVKKMADYVTCHCKKGAVADFLNYLKETRINDN